MPFTLSNLKRVVTYVAAVFAMVNTYVNVGSLPASVRSVIAAGGVLILAIEHAAGVSTTTTTATEASSTPAPPVA